MAKTKATKTKAQIEKAVTALMADLLAVVCEAGRVSPSVTPGHVLEQLTAAQGALAKVTHLLRSDVPAAAAVLEKGAKAATVDTSAMTDAQLFAHFKRIAVVEDLRFFLRVGQLSPELRARAEAIAKPTRQDITELRAAWRLERLAAERAAGVPAIGSPAWREQLLAELEAERSGDAAAAEAEAPAAAEAVAA